MKRIRKIAIAMLMLMTLMLTGCVRLNVEVTIKDNGKADVSMLYAVMSDDEDAAHLSEEDKDEIAAQGGEYSVYKQDGYVGYTFTIKDVSLDKLKKGEGVSEITDDISLKKTDKGYRFESTLFGGDNADDIQSTLEYLDSYGGYMKFTLNLPKPAIDSNATSITNSGKTLEWDATKMGAGETMYAEFEIPKGSSDLLFYIGVILGVVALVVVVVVLVTRKKKAAPGEAVVSEDVVYCTKCGAPMAKSTAFCTRCGNKMAVSEPQPVPEVQSEAAPEPQAETAPEAQPEAATEAPPEAAPEAPSDPQQ